MFWTDELFLDQLDSVLTGLGIQNNYDILGHSWGGMLAARHVVQATFWSEEPIIVSSSSDMRLWVEAQNKLRLTLPQDVQDTLLQHEKDGTTDSKAYQDAVSIFYACYLCILKPMLEPLTAALGWISKDPTVYLTMNGPSEFHITGSLKEWSITDEAHQIAASTLLINGRYDEATDEVVKPFFKEIPHVKWVQLAQSSHMPFTEERERFMRLLGEFLSTRVYNTNN